MALRERWAREYRESCATSLRTDTERRPDRFRIYSPAASGWSAFNWTKKYKKEFPAAIDPGSTLGPLFESNAFPANMIVNTRTMTIVEVIAGAPDAAFWTKFEKTIAGK